MQAVSKIPTSQLQVWEKAKEDLIPTIGAETLGFCSCEVGSVERRGWFTDRIVEDITRNFTDKSSPLVYVAFACGGLAHDYLILSRLIDQGYTRFEIHLIDPAFPKLSQENEKNILELVKKTGLEFFSDLSKWNPLKVVNQGAVSGNLARQAQKIRTLLQKAEEFAEKSPIKQSESVIEQVYAIHSLTLLIQSHNFEVLLKAKGVEKLNISRYLSAKDYLSSEGKISRGEVFVLMDPNAEEKTMQTETPSRDTINCLTTKYGAVLFPLDGRPVIKGEKLEPILAEATDTDSVKKILNDNEIFFRERSDIYSGFNDVAAGNSADKALFYILDEHSQKKIPDSIKMRPEDVTERLFMRSPFSRGPLKCRNIPFGYLSS